MKNKALHIIGRITFTASVFLFIICFALNWWRDSSGSGISTAITISTLGIAGIGVLAVTGLVLVYRRKYAWLGYCFVAGLEVSGFVGLLSGAINGSRFYIGAIMFIIALALLVATLIINWFLYLFYDGRTELTLEEKLAKVKEYETLRKEGVITDKEYETLRIQTLKIKAIKEEAPKTTTLLNK